MGWASFVICTQRGVINLPRTSSGRMVKIAGDCGGRYHRASGLSIFSGGKEIQVSARWRWRLHAGDPTGETGFHIEGWLHHHQISGCWGPPRPTWRLARHLGILTGSAHATTMPRTAEAGGRSFPSMTYKLCLPRGGILQGCHRSLKLAAPPPRDRAQRRSTHGATFKPAARRSSPVQLDHSIEPAPAGEGSGRCSLP